MIELSGKLREKVTAFLDETDVGGFLGEYGDPPDQDVPADPVARAFQLVSTYERHLHIVIDQALELEDPEYSQQARGEVVAILICLRELGALFPEVARPSAV